MFSNLYEHLGFFDELNSLYCFCKEVLCIVINQSFNWILPIWKQFRWGKVWYYLRIEDPEESYDIFWSGKPAWNIVLHQTNERLAFFILKRKYVHLSDIFLSLTTVSPNLHLHLTAVIPNLLLVAQHLRGNEELHPQY